MTTATLRLRQVCLVSHWLAPVADTVQAVFGVPVGHRDPAVAQFGLDNALFALGGFDLSRQPGDDATQRIARADGALYAAKQAGRDRVHTA